MTIRPVLQPDHDAVSLRGLMDRFAEASTGPTRQQLTESRAAVAAAEGVTEGLNESLSSMRDQDQAERNEYATFVKSQAGGDWSKGAKMYAQLKKRPSNDIFGDASRLNQFMKMKFDFNKFTDEDWDNYWLLAQHCDDNRDFQKNALSIIKKYQGTDHSHYKYLYDRISMGLTGKQKYGTQNVKAYGVAEGVTEGSVPGQVKKNKDGSYAATNQAGTRKIFKSERSAQAHANTLHDGYHVIIDRGTPAVVSPNGKMNKNFSGMYDAQQFAKKKNAEIDKKNVTEDDMSALAGYAAGIVGGAAVPFAAGSLAFAFRDALHRTDDLAKRKAQVDTAEIVDLQRQIVSINKMIGRVKTDATKEKYQTMLKKAYEVLDELKARPGNQVAEAGRPDVRRHPGDTTVKVVKRGGGAIGEIGTDAEASPGNGAYYVKLYDGSYDAAGYDSAEEALAELKAAIKQGVTETADGVKYGVFAKGGSVGSQRFRDDPLKTFDTKEEAVADARRRRSGLSKGERGYYGMGYVVKPIKGSAEQVDEKSEADRPGNRSHSIDHVDESVDPVEQLRADIKRFAQ